MTKKCRITQFFYTLVSMKINFGKSCFGQQLPALKQHPDAY